MWSKQYLGFLEEINSEEILYSMAGCSLEGEILRERPKRRTKEVKVILEEILRVHFIGLSDMQVLDHFQYFL